MIDLHSWCGCLYKGNLLFPNLDFNSFCSLNINNLTVSYEGTNPYEKIEAFGLYAQSVEKGEDSIFFPNSCRQIAVVNRKHNTFTWIDIPMENSNEFYASAGEILYFDKIYLFPQNLNMGIWEINSNDYSMSRRDDLNILIEGDKQIPGSPIIDVGNGKGAFITSDNGIRVFDLNSKETKKYIFKDKYSLYRCFYSEGYFWLIQNNSTTILRWNQKNDCITEYSLTENIRWFRGDIPYSKICFLDRKAIVLNNSVLDVMKFYPDIPEKGIVRAFSYPEGFGVSSSRLVEFAAVFDAFEKKDNKLFLIPSCADRMLVYDIFTENINVIDFSINVEKLPFVPKMEEIIIENPLFSLNKFLRTVI